MLELDELKRMHDLAYDHNTLTRERAADDLVFYWVTQWDDNLLDTSTLAYRGEFNVLRKAGRQIIADLRANPVQIDFEPLDEVRDDAADLIDGLYLTDDRRNDTLESYDNASIESVVCGVGGWELYTKYQSDRAGNENQIICRRPLYEANNNSFPDPNAKLLDKSDANYWSILEPFTHEGYRDLVKELTGEERDSIDMSSFSNPEESYTFPWAAGKNEAIYVVRFYHREKVGDIAYNIRDPFGQMIQLRESDISEVKEELADNGYFFEDERKIERWQVTLYIASGSEILDSYPIAGENIPVVHSYGERAYIEGEEHWEGVTRLAKDPQRLRNFQLSYLADIVSRSGREKPIVHPEQIQGHEHMWEANGADNNFPYLYMNRVTANGEPLPLGALATLPPAQISPALAASIDLSRQAVEDVANPGLPQDIADPDLSGKAVLALQARLDQQSMVYQENLKHAKRRDAQIYSSMAADVYDAPRTVTLTLQDGTRKKQKIMEIIQDQQTGEMVAINDLTNAEFDVYAEIGPSYSSKKEKTIEELNQDISTLEPGHPIREILILKKYELMDGVNFDDLRDYARKRLILQGVKEPDTEEEIAMLQQQQEGSDQPDAIMVAAIAEREKAQAANAREQRLAVLDQAKIANDQGKLQVDVFKAQTDRANMQVDAEKVGAEIDYTKIKTVGQQIDNIQKSIEPFRARLRSANG